MNKNDNIYVTTMYRWGNRECDSYVVYAGTSKNKAKRLGDMESSYRGGKYEPEVIEFSSNETVKYGVTKKVIYGKIGVYIDPEIMLCKECGKKFNYDE